ncbi:unnamed protein product [Adineta ricciae]|uniref:Uncharacterized protein n=1 Tax=Adineta ricciae TaxID=249248 RepID=A0A816BVB7_ADIRI|nr:unnamed protein product [Adineta ricciae]CAF1613935.1 unnamed protein product [Adineta ricciae]
MSQRKQQTENFSLNEDLIMLNKPFENRYTNENQEYRQMAESRSKTPPIFDDWNNHRSQSRHNYSRDHRYRSESSRSPSSSYSAQRR